MNFSATAIDPESSALVYIWDFGDETSATGSSVQKTYLTKGSYNAVVRISDEVNTVTSDSSLSDIEGSFWDTE